MNGNDMVDVLRGLKEAKSKCGNAKPILILMKTEMGYPIDFMIGSHKWHGVAPNDEQLAKALVQLPITLGDY
jgi:transketolase